MMKSLKILAAGLLLALAGTAQAQLAGKNVILVHGFQAGDLGDAPQSQEQIDQNGEAYWQAFWGARADARIDWGSHERVEGGIAERAFNQMVEISQQGLCNDGCILVTHSTGDLVARYFLEHQAHWLQSAGVEPLNILVALDFAGAGGGSELADVAVNAAMSDGLVGWAAGLALDSFLGTSDPDSLGVLLDLQPATARNLATSPNDVPRLRFVGGGSADSLNWARTMFLPGEDDGTVALHSTCGSTQANAYESCDSGIDLDGKLTSVDAPASLYFNHFPVLMGDEVNHSAVINNETGNTMTVAENNLNFSGVSISFNTETFEHSPWWSWSSDTFLVVSGSEQTSMSGLVVDTIQ